MPTLNIMQIQDKVLNSGFSSSWPSLIRPKRLEARKTANARKKAVETTKLHPKTRMIQFSTALAVTDRLSGASTPSLRSQPRRSAPAKRRRGPTCDHLKLAIPLLPFLQR